MSQEQVYWDLLTDGLQLFTTDERNYWRKWLDSLECAENAHWDVSYLPELLSMLALPFRNSMNIREAVWRRTNNFCNYSKISSGINCKIYPNDSLHNTIIHDDHFWPESLGGIRHHTNQLDLCRHHNEAKRNDIRGYDWEPKEMPEWIIFVLNQMRDDVMRNGRHNLP